jgi:Ca-activated chloride channel family protein
MRCAAPILCLLLASADAAQAEERAGDDSSWLRSENDHVRDGNALFKAGKAKEALAAYDRAARELPSEGGVHLNRGLALLKTGDLAAAREALRLATQPPAAKSVRADAYYDLGHAFYKDADASAGKNEHDVAQKTFREAADAFKQSLRLRPGDRNTAWNYELALRRIREQEQKQKEQQQKQDQQNQEQQKQDQQKQDQQNQDEQQQQEQDQQQQSQQDQQKQDQQNQEQQKQDQQKQDQQEQAQNQAQNQPQPQEPQVPREVERALDALQEGEDNLERLRAMQRAARERRVPEKDW